MSVSNARLNPEVATVFIHFFVGRNDLFPDDIDKDTESNFQQAKVVFQISLFYRARLRAFLKGIDIDIYTHEACSHGFKGSVACVKNHFRLFGLELHQFLDFHLHLRFLVRSVHVCERSISNPPEIGPHAKCIKGVPSDKFGVADVLSVLCQTKRLTAPVKVLRNLQSMLPVESCSIVYDKKCSRRFRDYYIPNFSTTHLEVQVKIDKINFFRDLPHGGPLQKSLRKLDLLLVVRCERGLFIRDNMEAILREYYPSLGSISFKFYWVTSSKPYILEFCQELLKLYEAGLYVRMDFLWNRMKEKHARDFLKKAGSNFKADMCDEDIIEEKGSLQFRYKHDGLIVNLVVDSATPEVGSVFYKETRRMGCGCINV